MNNYNTGNIIALTSALTWGLLYFIGLAIPEHHDNIKLGYDTCLLGLFLGYTLRHKKVQELIGLFVFIIVYNLLLFKRGPFQINSTDYFYYFARQYNIYFMILALVFHLPTLFEKYRLAPLTNDTNFKNSTIIIATVTLVIIIQTTVRLI
ncbi:hypothetical protein [Aurantibacillus circumpalustris]|uniref:hypothetical protein n=1 Tax=Aurantibacillus circumpalustris TaxID=3036359 RepID=UPI00295C31F6|nr:hypothetical protein [Aurantibacillus circumpalustris]